MRARVFVKDKLEHKHHQQQKLQQRHKLASVDTHLEQHGAHIESGSVIALDRVKSSDWSLDGIEIVYRPHAPTNAPVQHHHLVLDHTRHRQPLEARVNRLEQRAAVPKPKHALPHVCSRNEEKRDGREGGSERRQHHIDLGVSPYVAQDVQLYMSV